MKFPWIHHPGKGTPDVMTTLLVIVTLAAAIKFLLDGVSVTIDGHLYAFGQSQSMSYASILGPVFGAHGYMQGGGVTNTSYQEGKPDNVDA